MRRNLQFIYVIKNFPLYFRYPMSDVTYFLFITALLKTSNDFTCTQGNRSDSFPTPVGVQQQNCKCVVKIYSLHFFSSSFSRKEPPQSRKLTWSQPSPCFWAFRYPSATWAPLYLSCSAMTLRWTRWYYLIQIPRAMACYSKYWAYYKEIRLLNSMPSKSTDTSTGTLQFQGRSRRAHFKNSKRFYKTQLHISLKLILF